MKASFIAVRAAGAALLVAMSSAEAAVLYHVVDLGTVNGAFRSEARGINQKGEVWCENFNTDYPYFLWKNGTNYGVAKPAEVATMALYGRNDAGQFAGTLSYFTARPTIAFRDSPARPQLLVTNFAPRGLNFGGDVVGVTSVRVESPPGSGIFFTVNRPAIARGKKLTPLSTLAGDNAPVSAEGTAINDSGAVVGWSVTTSNVTHAFLWDGSMHDLHTLNTRSNTIAAALNQNGVVVGYMYNFSTFREPFIWTPADGMTALNLPAGYSTGQPLGLNNRGDVVGVAGASAVVWTNGVMTDLQTVIPTSPAWDLDGAYGINDAGEIVGYGKNGGLTKGFLLRPTNIPPAQFTIELLDPADAAVSNAFTGVSVTTESSILNALSAHRIGLAADAAAMLLVKCSTTNQGTFSLSLRAADGASGTTGIAAEDGALGGLSTIPSADQFSTHTFLTVQGLRAFGLYRAPRIFHRSGQNDSDRVQRVVTMQATFMPDSGTAATQRVSVVIARPPVIVLHGLWSDRNDAFAGFERDFAQAEAGVQFFGPSYPNAVYFKNNANVVPDEIANARDAFRQDGFACVRADIFSHSMGGVLSRIYARSAGYKRADNYQLGDIHRLVTIDSPHRGSFIADIQDGLFPWLAQTSWGQKQRDAIEFLMQDMGKPVTKGATYDLSSTSAETVKMNQRPTDVAAHVIAGDFEIVADYTQYPPPFGAIYKLFYKIPGFDYTPVRFQIPFDNDLVVSLDSQGAGLLTTDASSIYAHHHVGAPNTTNVVVRSLFLYRQRPEAPWYWPGFPTGWSPPYQAELPPPPATGPTATNNTSLLLLASGPDIAPGQQVQATVTPPNGISFDSVLIMTRNVLVEDTNAPFSTLLTVAVDAAGDYPVSYVARDAGTNLWWGTQMLNVLRGQAQYLEVEPAIFTFTRLGAQRQMTVRGIYPGGITRDLTAATTDTLYSSADTNVVTVETNGVVTATGSGATQVTISNAGRTSVVNVAVSLLPAPDVALTQSVSATQANASAPLVFTLAVTNASAEPATGVYLSDLLPAGAQFVSASASQGMWSYTNGLFACELGVLAPGSSATVTLTLAFNIGGPQTNEAVVTAVGVDANPANNVASAVVNITALPVLTIQLSGTNLVLKWPTNATGFQLEETFDLAPLSSWNSLTTNPPAIGSNYEVMLPAPPNPAFFRLNRP